MLGNTGNVAKLYMSIIEDVIESVRELIVDEGLEDRVLDDLKRMWEAKVMASKALEDIRHNNITSSKFVLQLPAHYNHSDQDRRPRVAVGIPTSQNAFHFPLKKGSETLATFSLPPGLSYPVQIPAGVTLQTASGQLYKVNVPVVVTQGPAGSNTFSQTTQKMISWRESSVPQPTGGTSLVKTIPPKVGPAPPPTLVPPAASQPPPASPPPSAESQPQPAESQPPPAESQPPPAESQPPPAESQPPQSQKTLIHNQSQEDMASQQIPQAPLAVNLQSQVFQQQPEVMVEGGAQPGQEPGNTGVDTPISEFFDLRTESLETLARAPAGSVSNDIDDILKQVIEEEMNKAVTETVFSSYPELSDIVQLDGPLDNSDIEAEDEVALEDNDFLGMINAEAMKDGSSDGDGASSSSDSDAVDELPDVVEEDPLNSGDDVHEQDIPDLFDTDNVIVCQYDKIHRSKNRWKFHLKDAVMCYGGRDYVFSKAVGEAEW